jgi:hypothetical protein
MNFPFNLARYQVDAAAAAAVTSAASEQRNSSTSVVCLLIISSRVKDTGNINDHVELSNHCIATASTNTTNYYRYYF